MEEYSWFYDIAGSAPLSEVMLCSETASNLHGRQALKE